ncbi:MAG: adenylosuccinate lyase [Thermoproteota archaeon]|nr:MAG: adenylosuccinate lyase [Candidatus Korarchaeota archaeon]
MREVVHPVDYRYGSREMRRVFSREHRLELMLRVEAALAEAHAEIGNIPKWAARVISEKATPEHVKLERVDEIEREIKHETMAVVKALAEVCGKAGGYVHFGATSNDILDCTLAIQLKEASKIIEGRLMELLRELARLAMEYRSTPCLGRTHGMAALPVTFGFKMAVFASEFKRHLSRLRDVTGRVCVGKMSGAVGTMAEFGENGLELQRRVMSKLGIKSAEISTQIVPRDLLAEFICYLGLLSSSLDKLANEVRNLQRTEVGEVEEPFERERQVGSSTMPHKRNPISCERVCGLARVLRGLVVAALENVVLEHERDLTNSSCERAVVPEACLLVDEQLRTMVRVLKGLVVHEDRMLRNLLSAGDLIMAEAIMLEAVRRGADRQRMHEVVRQLAMEAIESSRSFRELLKQSSEVRRYFTEREIDDILDPRRYTGLAAELAEMVAKSVMEALGAEEVA